MGLTGQTLRHSADRMPTCFRIALLCIVVLFSVRDGLLEEYVECHAAWRGAG